MIAIPERKEQEFHSIKTEIDAMRGIQDEIEKHPDFRCGHRQDEWQRLQTDKTRLFVQLGILTAIHAEEVEQ